MLENHPFKGLGTALVTPFRKNLSIDFEGLKNLLNLQKQNADYLVVMGTTGESVTLSKEEKSKVLNYVKENSDGMPILYGVGGNNTESVIEEIKHTDLSGINGILSVSPYYNKPSQEGIIHHYKKIAEKSPIPVILYNVPGRTGSNINPATTVSIAKNPNIIGIKEANTDINQINELVLKLPANFSIISGDDMSLISVLAAGGQGLISVLSNAFPEVFKNVFNHFENGNLPEARKELYSLVDLNPLMYLESNPVGIKQVLSELHICQPYVRLPLLKASPSLKNKIRETLKNR